MKQHLDKQSLTDCVINSHRKMDDDRRKRETDQAKADKRLAEDQKQIAAAAIAARRQN